VHEELGNGGLKLKRDLEKLLNGEELRYPINETITFGEVGHNPENIWSFLYFAGYLKANDPQPHPRKRTQLLYSLSIPNLEVERVFEEFVELWHRQLNFSATEELLTMLLDDNVVQFEWLLNELVCNLVSCHDVAKYPEAAYHAFVLGLLVNLRNVYEIRSNPETGYGRADIVLRPKTTDYPLAFIIEFKSIAVNGDVELSATAALAQIEEKNYEAQLLEAGIAIEYIRKLAIVVSGKRVIVRTP
jgi:hypothetical protein